MRRRWRRRRRIRPGCAGLRGAGEKPVRCARPFRRPAGCNQLRGPTEAPTPQDQMVCKTTLRLPRSDMRPPCSALASIGSTSRCGRQRDTSRSANPKIRPADRWDRDRQARIDKLHGRQAVLPGNIEEKPMQEVGGVAHRHHAQPGQYPDDKGKYDQARLARAHDPAQHTRDLEGACHALTQARIERRQHRWKTLHRSKRTAYLYRPLINFQFKKRQGRAAGNPSWSRQPASV